MRKTERNFTNKVLESKRGDVQAVKSKIKSSVMAVAFLFAATMPLTMAVSSRNVQAAVTPVSYTHLTLPTTQTV